MKMQKAAVTQALYDTCAFAVVRVPTVERGCEIAEGLLKGGVKAMEISYTLPNAGDETGPAPHGNAGEKRLAVPHEDVAQVVAGNAGELVDGRDGRGPVVGHVPLREEARDVEGNLRVE